MNHGFVLEQKHKRSNPFFGKYRAIVLDNNDPERRMRIKVKCPKVLGASESNWALPCIPSGYEFLPPIGGLVWVEFEEGDPNKPIWAGTWRKPDETPSIVYDNAIGRFIIYTNNGKIVVDDINGTVTIEATGKLVLKGQQIEITGDTTIQGNIAITGNGTLGGRPIETR